MALRSRSTTRRTQGEILLVILRAVYKEPLGPTSIMYKANLSWAPLKRKYLPPLLVLKLLIAKETKIDNRTRNVYLLTKRGEIIANACKKYKVITFALEKIVMDTAETRRNKMDLIIDILSVTKGRQQITSLMDLAEMSYKPFSRYLEILCRCELIMMFGKKGERPEYVTTKNGLELIQLYENAILYITKIMRQEHLDEPIARHIEFYKQL